MHPQLNDGTCIWCFSFLFMQYFHKIPCSESLKLEIMWKEKCVKERGYSCMSVQPKIFLLHVCMLCVGILREIWQTFTAWTGKRLVLIVFAPQRSRSDWFYPISHRIISLWLHVSIFGYSLELSWYEGFLCPTEWMFQVVYWIMCLSHSLSHCLSVCKVEYKILVILQPLDLSLYQTIKF